MDEVQEFVNDIRNTLESRKNKYITVDTISNIDDNVTKICEIYDDKVDSLIHDMKVLVSKQQKESNDLIEQFNTKFQKERDLRNKLNRIWKGKLLMRQIANDRFYRIAMKNKENLDCIKNQIIENKLIELGIKMNRTNVLSEHIGAKMAYAIICNELSISGVLPKFCIKYINDNDMMHPDCKPLAICMNDLRTFETTVKSLSIAEQKEFDIEADIITEEIQFFISTEK